MIAFTLTYPVPKPQISWPFDCRCGHSGASCKFTHIKELAHRADTYQSGRCYLGGRWCDVWQLVRVTQ